MALRTVPAPFLTKTFQLVDDRSSDDVISWNEAGTAFVVWKMADFAKDLLPSYFKHNNFSSFVRQLNTYGFRKIVPDKWEFANDNFKRGQKELLTKIRRRKTVSSTPAAKKLAAACDGPSTPSNSEDDQGSASMSSPDSKNAGSVDAPTPAPVTDLSGENEKLKRENDLLNSELAQSKKQCEELVAFLTDHVKIGSDQIDRIMRQGTSGSTSIGEIDGCDEDNIDDDDDDENGGEESDDDMTEVDEGFRLFGVWVKGDRKKRGRDGNTETEGTRRCKGLKAAEFDAPWMKISPSPGMSGKVCERQIRA